MGFKWEHLSQDYKRACGLSRMIDLLVIQWRRTNYRYCTGSRMGIWWRICCLFNDTVRITGSRKNNWM